MPTSTNPIWLFILLVAGSVAGPGCGDRPLAAYGGAAGGGGTGPEPAGAAGDPGSPINAGDTTVGQPRRILSFLAPVDYAVGGNPRAIALGDLNGDRDRDLVVGSDLACSSCGTLSVLLNDGNGAFAVPVSYPAGPVSWSIALGDLNGDGKPDLAAVGKDSVSVVLNKGGGVLAVPDNYAARGPYSLALGDVNGDGRADLAVADYTEGEVSVLLNKGDAAFSAAANYAAGTWSYAVALGDLNGDGWADLAVANSAGDLAVLLNKGDGTFAAAVHYAAGMGRHSIVVGDLNGDGRADLAIANSSPGDVSVLLNRGDGAFAAPVGYATGPESISVAIGDLDGDGKADLVVANYGAGGSNDGNVSVLLNNGDGTFAAAVITVVGVGPTSLAVGDLNGDDRPDLVVVNRGDVGRGDGSVSVLLNDSR